MTKDEAKKLLSEMHGNCIAKNIKSGYDDPKRLQKSEALIMAIGALNTDKWTYTKDENPDDDREVLIAFYYKWINEPESKQHDILLGLGYFHRSDEWGWDDDYWVVHGSEEMPTIVHAEVIAWCDLPEPPKEDSMIIRNIQMKNGGS